MVMLNRSCWARRTLKTPSQPLSLTLGTRPTILSCALCVDEVHPRCTGKINPNVSPAPAPPSLPEWYLSRLTTALRNSPRYRQAHTPLPSAISCFLCGLRVWVGAGAGKLRARTRISQPSYRPMALPTLLDLISCFRLRYCRFADLPRRPACRRMLWGAGADGGPILQ